MLRGRERELATLVEALTVRRPVVLVGPAGVGKTSLGAAALAEIGTFRSTGALATQQWSPLLLYRRLLGGGATDDPAAVAGQVVQRTKGGLLLDDLQWADDLSLEATDNLVGHLPLVATVRSAEPGSDRAVGALELVGFQRMEVHPLPPSASAALLDEVAPRLTERRRTEVLATAAGNPLLLVELATSEPGTPSLVSALHGRLADLAPDAQQAMERLSVLGRPADAELLGRGCSDLVRSGLAIEEGTQLRVRHDLLAELVVDDLGERAADVRLALADLVEPDEGAFLRHAAGDLAGAREMALAAADGATFAARAELLGLAMECAPNGDLDVENRIAAARALTWSGQAERTLAMATVDGIEDLAPVERGTLRGVAAEAAWFSRRVDRFVELIGLAVEDLRGTGTIAEVEVLASSTIVDTSVHLDGAAALGRARDAVELADRLGARRGYARTRLASVLASSGTTGWVDTFREAYLLACEEGDYFTTVIAKESLVLGEWMSGEVDAAARSVKSFWADGPPAGHDADWLSHCAYLGVVELVAASDRLDLVQRWSAVLGAEPLFRNREYAEAVLSLSLADLGRHEEAADVLAGAASRPRRDPQVASVTAWALVETAVLAGRAAEALLAVEHLEQYGVAGYPPVVMARLVGAQAALDMGVAPSGPEPVAAMPGWEGAPLEWRAMVALSDGSAAEAVHLFDAAAAAWAGRDRRCEVRARWSAGEAARRAGRDDAVARLVAAEAEASRLQVGDVVARARRSLREAGVTLATERTPGRSGLTARQVQVLERVGAGLTTNDIAAELRITAATVDATVRAACRRLGVPNRRAAAAALGVGVAGPGSGADTTESA